MNVASFPGSPCMRTKAMESWAGPGNEARINAKPIVYAGMANWQSLQCNHLGMLLNRKTWLTDCSYVLYAGVGWSGLWENVRQPTSTWSILWKSSLSCCMCSYTSCVLSEQLVMFWCMWSNCCLNSSTRNTTLCTRSSSTCFCVRVRVCVCVCVCAFVCVCDLPLLLASPSLVGPSINNSQASAQIFISEQKLTFHYNYEMKSSQSFHIFEIESAQPRSKFFLVSVLTACSADKSGETTQKLERKTS